MINSIDEYIRQLRKELAGCDRATIQDALSDAREHLRNSLESKPDMTEAEVLGQIINGYGAPGEIAAAYKEMEHRSVPSLAPARKPARRSWLSGFFGVVADPRAYGAFVYLLFSLVLGVIYFTWAVTGISLSLGLIVMIFGIVILGIFVLSIRGISLIEGRLVEALLGIRMPRRPFFTHTEHGLWPRFKSLVADKYTWLTLIYMIIMLPLGTIYFSVFVALVASSVWLVFEPVFQLIFDTPLATTDRIFLTPGWAIPLSIIGGVLLFVVTMHLAKITGKLHGQLAKIMLVRQ